MGKRAGRVARSIALPIIACLLLASCYKNTRRAHSSGGQFVALVSITVVLVALVYFASTEEDCSAINSCAIDDPVGNPEDQFILRF